MLKQKYFLTGIFILSAERQPIKLAWRKIVWLQEACRHLKRQYDGYHFSKNCEDIYNPFSLFNAFSQKDYKSFWFSTGTSTFLIEMLQRMDFSLNLLEKMEVKDEDFIIPFNGSIRRCRSKKCHWQG